ncbi:MAG: hypothetical protein WCC60_20465 [Ilumatobacteraceae bacterium]
MRDRKLDLQLIEVLSPDDPSLGSEPPAAPIPPTPSAASRPSRRTVAVAGFTAAALVATMWVVFASGDEARRASTPTTTAAPTVRLAPAPTDATMSGRFVIDDPTLRPYSADITTPLTRDASFAFWTSGNATEPWLMVETTHNRSRPFAFRSSSRRVVDGRELVTPDDQRSTTILVADLGEGWTATIRAFRVDDPDLVRFAAGVSVRSGHVVFDAEQPDGLARYSTAADVRSADQLLYGAVNAEMRALTTSGELITLRIADGPEDVRWRSLPWFTTGRVEGSDGFTAGTLTSTGEAVVLWSQGSHRLSLTGRLTTEELLSISHRVRPAAEAEWRGLLHGLHPDYRVGEFAAVGTGTASDGSTWTAGVQLAERDHRTMYLWWWTDPQAPQRSVSLPARNDLALVPATETIVVAGATYVYLSAPSASAATKAIVHAGDGSQVVVPLTQPFPSADLRLGAIRIDAPGEITVQFDESVAV